MPYIKERQRDIFDKSLDGIMNRANVTNGSLVKGDLTYCFYKMALDYIAETGMNYQNISDACAALSDAEFEIRRRVMSKYEDAKIISNGDILWYINHLL